jgi:flagellar capping protein FliD
MADIRIGGLVSGMDIQGTITKILDLRAKSITKLEEKKVTLQADVAAWTDIGGYVSNLTESLYNLRSYDLWNKQSVTSSDAARVGGLATGSAAAGVYNISVSQVAQAHSIASDTFSSLGLSGRSATLVGAVAGLSAGDSFTIGGQTITIGVSDTMASLATKINDASALMSASNKVTASIIADRLAITRDNTGSTEISISDGSGTPLADLGLLETVTAKPQPPDGNVLWLEMQSNASPAIVDSSGYGNHGVEVDGAVWTPSGKFDGGYVLDGVNDAVSLGQSPELDGFGEFTWSAWVKTTQKNSTVMNYGDRADGAGISIDISATGEARVNLDDGAATAVATGTTDISDGAWHLITVTNDGSTLRLYVDGNTTPEGTADSSGVGYITTNDGDGLQIGRKWESGSYTGYFNGSVDDVMVFGRGLSAAEAGALYSSTTGSSFKNELVSAQDSVFTVNGASVTRSGNKDLTDVISGVSLELLGVTTSDVSLEISNDTDSVKTALNYFIMNYNLAVNKLESYVDINLDNPRKPIVGELQGDTLVGSILFNLRKLVTGSKTPYFNSTNASYRYGGNDGVMDSLEDVGVGTTGSENEISINDEAKLDYLLKNYYSKVEQLFRGISGSNGFEHGVAEELYDYSYGLSTSLTGRIDIRKSSISQELERYGDKVDRMYDDLDAYEQSLWAQFGAMEEAMSKLKGQTAWLQSLGAG